VAEFLHNPSQGLSTTRRLFRASLTVQLFFSFFGLPIPGRPAAGPRNGTNLDEVDDCLRPAYSR